MKELLKELVETPGVSGREDEIRKLIRNKVEDYVDDIDEDGMGSLITRKKGSGPRLMIAAHMDQIGFSVSKITKDGKIYFEDVGGHTEEDQHGQKVVVHGEEEIPGIIGIKPPHGSYEDGGRTEDLYVDVGASDHEEVEDLGIDIGDIITYSNGLTELHNNYVTGPALDNRVGCAVAIEALKRFEGNYELLTVFPAREEVGLKGADTSAFKLDPDVALAVDVSVADNYKEDETGVVKGDVELEEGVDIGIMQGAGRGLITTPEVEDWLTETAHYRNHNHQKTVESGGYTDAAKIQLVREGIPSGSLGIPTNYIHSAAEKVSLEDMRETVEYMEDLFDTFNVYFPSKT